MTLPSLLFLVLAVPAPKPAAPQGAVPPDSTRLRLATVAAAPGIDGVLDEGEWAGVAPAELRYQVEPGDNLEATERTLVYLAADRETLYLAVRAFDSEPAAVRARMSRRDDISADDYFTLLLDTFDDGQRAYRFAFNPLGVQEDGISLDSDLTSTTWDGVLESKGRMDDQGWTVEAAIPFATLRYRAGAQARWGIHLRRYIARKAERASFTPVNRNVNGLLGQMATLEGLGEVRRQRSLDLIPTLVGSSTLERVSAGASGAGRDLTRNDADPGLSALFAVTPTLTLAGALNPDFSQVESDLPQITVNQRFALFYPEKRPFFLEAQDVFQEPFRTSTRPVDTRRIVDPDWGVRLTGKIGRGNLGIISASDGAAGRFLAPGPPDAGRNAFANVVRYRRDVFKDSFVGGFVNDRRFAGARNTVVVLDGRLRIGEPLSLGFQGLRTLYTNAAGASSNDWAGTVRVENVGRHWRIYASDRYVGPAYRNELGFVDRTGFHEQFLDIGYEWRPKANRWVVYVWPYVLATHARTTDGQPEQQYVDSSIEVLFTRNVQLNYYHSVDREGFAGGVYRYGFDNFRLRFGRWKKLSFETRVVVGEGLNYDPDRPLVGDKLFIEQSVQLKPTDKLSLDVLFLKSRLKTKDAVEHLVDQEIYRARLGLQASRSHGGRTIVEYDSFAGRLGLSLLYTYLPRANTAVYVGYDDLLYDERDPATGRPIEGFVRGGRTFFVKVSYGWRL